MTSTNNSKTNQYLQSGMPDSRVEFYHQSIQTWITDKNASILIVGGGETDMTVFQSLGFTNVVISNLDARLAGNEFSPYLWSFQQAENLSYDSGQFDFVVVHAALHHCESPHKALLEMYRVAKLGVIAFESRDSMTMRILERLGLTLTYEHMAVYYNGGKFGGVNNTEVPNYIYRWTEREIEKTINTYESATSHNFTYAYGNDTPSSAGIEKGASLKTLVIAVMKPFYLLLVLLFPKQQNLFGFYITKPSLEKDLHPWLSMKDGKPEFNMTWAREIYK